MRSTSIVKLFFLQMIISLVFAGSINAESPAGNAFKIPEKNFETPEAAIQHFVERLAANDLSGAFEACDINEADLFNYTVFTHYLRAMIPLTSPAPTKSPMLAQTNRIIQMAQIARQIRIMTYSFFTKIPLNGNTTANPTDKDIENFINETDARNLAGLKIEKIQLPVSAKILNSERARKNAVEQARPNGADDSTERIVLYNLNNEWFCGGFRLMKYGKYWRIDSLYSSFANLSSTGVLKRTSPDEFDSMDDD
jgi:hypothetical protein